MHFDSSMVVSLFSNTPESWCHGQNRGTEGLRGGQLTPMGGGGGGCPSERDS